MRSLSSLLLLVTFMLAGCGDPEPDPVDQQPFGAPVLVTEQAELTALVADQDGIYWTAYIDGASEDLWALPAGESTPVHLSAGGGDYPFGNLQVAADDLVYGFNDVIYDSCVKAIDKRGGAPARELYCADGKGVFPEEIQAYTLGVSGNAASFSAPYLVAPQGAVVRGIFRADLTDDSVVEIAAGIGSTAVTEDHVYWTETPGGIVRSDGGEVEVVIERAAPGMLRVDGDDLFWIENETIYQLADPPIELVAGAGEVRELEVDADFVYWFTDRDDTGVGTIHAVPRGGGEPIELATGFEMAVSSAGVYYVDGDDIMLLPRLDD